MKTDITATKTGPPGHSIQCFKKDTRAKMPHRANELAIGYDVFAFILTESGRPSKKAIGRTETAMIPTGLVLRPPEGYYVQVHSRSGLAAKSIFVANGPGIIDPDYTGELFILLHNSGFETHWIEHEHRIAQLVLTPISQAYFQEIAALPHSDGRGSAGFGSTGL